MHKIFNFHLPPSPACVALHCYALNILLPRTAFLFVGGSLLFPHTTFGCRSDHLPLIGGYFRSHRGCSR